MHVSAMYASRAHHSSLASSFASSNLFSSVKNNCNSSRNSYTRARTLPRDNQSAFQGSSFNVVHHAHNVIQHACSRYSDVTRKISSPVVLSGIAFQKRKFSRIVSPSTKRMLAISCAWPLISVDSSSCKAYFSVQRIFSKTTLYGRRLFINRLTMVLSERGTLATSFSASGPRRALTKWLCRLVISMFPRQCGAFLI